MNPDRNPLWLNALCLFIAPMVVLCLVVWQAWCVLRPARKEEEG